MDANLIQKMNDLFSESRKLERITAGEAMALVGASIRKSAVETNTEVVEIQARLQRTYLLAQQIEKWASQEGEEIDDVVEVPSDLLAELRKDAEGKDAEIIPISDAMKILKSRLGKGLGKEDGAQQDVKKSDQNDGQVTWHDFSVTSNKSDADESWGPDPTDLR